MAYSTRTTRWQRGNSGGTCQRQTQVGPTAGLRQSRCRRWLCCSGRACRHFRPKVAAQRYNHAQQRAQTAFVRQHVHPYAVGMRPRCTGGIYAARIVAVLCLGNRVSVAGDTGCCALSCGAPIRPPKTQYFATTNKSVEDSAQDITYATLLRLVLGADSPMAQKGFTVHQQLQAVDAKGGSTT